MCGGGSVRGGRTWRRVMKSKVNMKAKENIAKMSIQACREKTGKRIKEERS